MEVEREECQRRERGYTLAYSWFTKSSPSALLPPPLASKICAQYPDNGLKIKLQPSACHAKYLVLRLDFLAYRAGHREGARDVE